MASPGSASTTRRSRALNPRLVHLAISGYGSSGPAADRPGYDFIVQAVSGLMSITGAPDADGGGPTKVGVAISDILTGLLGCRRVARRARRARARRRAPIAGAGQRVDVSILGATLASLVNQAQNAFVSGSRPGTARQRPPEHRPVRDVRHGRRRDRGRGRVGAAVAAAVRRARARRALAEDPRFATNGDRVENRSALRPILAEAFAARTTADWCTALDAAEIPCRADQRRRRRVRFARGGRARHDRRAGAPGVWGDPSGRAPVPVERDARPRSARRRRPSARTPTRSSASSATSPPRSTTSAPAASSDGHSRVQACTYLRPGAGRPAGRLGRAHMTTISHRWRHPE